MSLAALSSPMKLATSSGVCFFSNWNHEFAANATIPHCLHWCALDDPAAPSRCAAGEPLAGGPAASVVSGRFCAEPQQAKDGSTVFVAPHGLLIGDAAQEGDGWRLELLASFADGLQGMDVLQVRTRGHGTRSVLSPSPSWQR